MTVTLESACPYCLFPLKRAKVVVATKLNACTQELIHKSCWNIMWETAQLNKVEGLYRPEECSK